MPDRPDPRLTDAHLRLLEMLTPDGKVLHVHHQRRLPLLDNLVDWRYALPVAWFKTADDFAITEAGRAQLGIAGALEH